MVGVHLPELSFSLQKTLSSESDNTLCKITLPVQSLDMHIAAANVAE